MNCADSHSNGEKESSTDVSNKNVSALETIRTKYHLPALAIGQGKPGTFASLAVGVRKQGDPTPALDTDIYHLGSNTKAMVATLLAILIQDGQLSWSATLPEVLPTFNISDAHRRTTLEMLTSHRSGITDDFFQDQTFVLSLFNLSALEGRWAVSNLSLARPPSQEQGSFNYANTNYILAGLVIDVSTNSSAEEMLQRRVFSPLGITTAGFGPSPEQSDTSVDNPWPHTASSSGPEPLSQVPNKDRDNAPALNTAGRCHMTPGDYNRFLQLHLAGADGRSSANTTTNPLILDAASFAKLHEPFPDDDTSSPGYGYTYGGWIRRNYTAQGTPFTLAHDGSNTLNYAHVVVDTGADEAFMALTNVGGDEALTGTGEAVEEMRGGTIKLV